MKVNFTKMHGIGNDYIYVDCLEESLDNPGELSKEMSQRHFSVGADGLVMICPSDVADARMRMFNADGSEGSMCGNAIRCVARYLHDNAIGLQTVMTIETKSGIKKIKVCPHCELISVDMGKADFDPNTIPVISDKEKVQNEPITIDNTEYKMTCVSMGNPHAVVYVDDVDAIDIETIGPLFENDPLFPDRINTEFVQVIGPDQLKMRVWERGSGETYACGTGASAIVAASVLNGICEADKPITVNLIGGDLIIICKDNWEVVMKGTATKVYDGVYEYEQAK